VSERAVRRSAAPPPGAGPRVRPATGSSRLRPCGHGACSHARVRAHGAENSHHGQQGELGEEPAGRRSSRRVHACPAFPPIRECLTPHQSQASGSRDPASYRHSPTTPAPRSSLTSSTTWPTLNQIFPCGSDTSSQDPARRAGSARCSRRSPRLEGALRGDAGYATALDAAPPARRPHLFARTSGRDVAVDGTRNAMAPTQTRKFTHPAPHAPNDVHA
jgi:hypothetical protein